MTLTTAPKVSILVPCFNVETFVAECLTSIRQQTLHDIEVICLNDGSTDKTLDIMRQTVGDDPRFRIVDKPNSGYGATMNLGLTMAKGDYIGIVESDDFVEPDMFRALYEEAVQHDLDISRCTFNMLREGDIKTNTCPYLPKTQVFDPKVELDAFRHPPSIWAAIYRRSLLQDWNIRFLETPGAAYQDISFAFKTTMAATRIRCLPQPLLNYRIHQNNSVKKASNALIVIDEIDECLTFARRHHAEDLLGEVMVDIEYATFKWNYLRLPQAAAHAFFQKWLDRWIRNKGYGVRLRPSSLKTFLHYVAVTKFPERFENYLRAKSK